MQVKFLHYLYIIYTLSKHYLYIIYTLSKHYLYIIYTLSIHYLYIIYTLSIHYLYPIYTLFIHYLHRFYTLSIHYLYIIYTLSIHYLYTIYTLSIHYLHTIRFHFPRPLHLCTRVVVKQIPFKASKDKGELRRTSSELSFATNDGWLNSHCVLGMMAWGANTDFSLLIDCGSIVNYCAKYCAKSETPTTALQLILSTTIRRREERGQDTRTSNVLRAAFNKVAGQRDKCMMESCHLLNSTPIAVASHKFTTISILSNIRKVNTPAPAAAEENVPALVKSIRDLYAFRLNCIHWQENTLFLEHTQRLVNMPFSTFIRIFRKNMQHKLVLKTGTFHFL